jgi:hypothetical protein
VLPNRPRLRGWNPASLAASAAAITASAEAVVDAVAGIDHSCQQLPDLRAWSGKSHEAASAMFARAHRQTTSFGDYARGAASAFAEGGRAIGAARSALLAKADEVDTGPLHVDDNWVVLIDQATMSAEQAASLVRQAEQEQLAVNELLLAVGDADDETAAAVQSAAKPFGYEIPEINLLGGLTPPPGNEVPNPRWPDGLIQQDIMRKNDMAMSVREEKVEYTADDQVVTTLTMQDGSKHILHEWGHEVPHVSDDYYAPDGQLVSSSTSFTDPSNGVKTTEIQWGDGTILTMTQAPGGTLAGGVTTADGRHAPLPPEFFSHPILTTVQGGMTLLDKQAASGRGIPMLNASAVENIGKAGRYAGPAMGVATALWDVVTADTLRDACVASFSGVAGIAGGEVSGAVLAGVVAEAPAAVPWAYAGGSMFGGWAFGYVGGLVGNAVCK